MRLFLNQSPLPVVKIRLSLLLLCACLLCLPVSMVYSAVKKHIHTRRSLHSREKVGQLSHKNSAFNKTNDFICIVANTADVRPHVCTH